MRRLVPIPPQASVTVDFEGEEVQAREGEPVAVSLLAAGHSVLSRSVKYHRPRGPFCLQAACSHCLLRVDGTPNLFSCRVAARAGQELHRQNSYPSAKVDVFSAIDWLFPGGLDHHAMFAGVPVAERVMVKVARHLAGLGLLPDKPAPERPTPLLLETEVAIAGGGAAGLAAAEVLSAKGIRFLLLEREEALGGRWRLGAPESGGPARMEVTPGTGEVQLRTTVVGLYNGPQGRFLAAVAVTEGGPRLLLVRARRFLLALGGHASLLPFLDNDLPGVFAGRAVSDLVRRRGVLPTESPAVVGHGPELPALAQLLAAAGAPAALVLDTGSTPADGARAGAVLEAHGRARVQALSVQLTGAGRKRVDCDAVILSTPPTPAYEVAVHAGAHTAFHPGLGVFVVEADAEGRTAAQDVSVAGDALGGTTAALAAESGRRAASALARELGR